jgi:hypothetical protein
MPYSPDVVEGERTFLTVLGDQRLKPREAEHLTFSTPQPPSVGGIISNGVLHMSHGGLVGRIQILLRNFLQ